MRLNSNKLISKIIELCDGIYSTDSIEEAHAMAHSIKTLCEIVDIQPVFESNFNQTISERPQVEFERDLNFNKAMEEQHGSK